MNEEQTTQPAQEPKSNKKPFIIVLVVLVLLAATGYAVYSWQQNQVQSLTNQINELKKEVGEARKSPALDFNTITKDANAGYLVVTEWGVRVKPVAGSTSYIIQTNNGISTAYFSNITSTNLGGSCDAKAGLAAITRYTKMQDENGSIGQYKGKIGDYYYYTSASNGLCSDNTTKEAAARKELLDTVNTVEAAQK